MKYELSHDSIARQIFEKSSTESKARRKAENFVLRAYTRYQEKGILLSQDDIDEIKPFEHLINFNKAQRDFLRISRQKLVAIQVRKRRITAGIITLLSFFLLIAIWQWSLAKKSAIKEKRIRLSLHANEALENGQTSVAFRLLEAAYHPDNDAMTTTAIQHTMDALYENGLWADLQHSSPIISFAISPDNQYIASLSTDGQAKLWNSEGQLIKVLPQEDTWTQIAFSKRNNQLIALSRDGKFVFWNNDGTKKQEFQTNKTLSTFVVHPMEELIIQKEQQSNLSLYDWQGKRINTLAYSGRIKNVEFSPNGDYLLVVTDSLVEVRLLDFVRKKLPMVRFSRHLPVKNAEFVQADQSDLETVIFTDSGLQFLDSDGVLDTTSAYAFLNRQKETRNNSKIVSIAYTSQSSFPKLLFRGRDSTVLLWSKIKKDINTGKKISNFDYRITKSTNIVTATFSGTDQYCLISGANKVNELLDLQTKQTWKRFKADIKRAHFASNDHFFVTSNGGNTLQIWKIKTSDTNAPNREIIEGFSKRLRFLSDKEKEQYQL